VHLLPNVFLLGYVCGAGECKRRACKEAGDKARDRFWKCGLGQDKRLSLVAGTGDPYALHLDKLLLLDVARRSPVILQRSSC